MAVDQRYRVDPSVDSGPLTTPTIPSRALPTALAVPATPVVSPCGRGGWLRGPRRRPTSRKPVPLLGRVAAPPLDTPVNASRELDHVVRHPVDVPARPRPRRDVSSSRPDFSMAISRALGTIVVTVHGALDGVRSGELRRILGDLIGRHDNRDVVVDLIEGKKPAVPVDQLSPRRFAPG